MNDSLFTVKSLGDGIYSVSSPQWLGDGISNRFAPIMQSYVVVGKEKCLVIDSPSPEIPGFCDFIYKAFNMPIMAVNTHGHIDHTGCNSQFGTVYLSPKDFDLVRGGGISRGNADICYQMMPLYDGDRVELGKRMLCVIPLPGHTAGSIGFLDENTDILFSGDAIARRVLYGLSDSVPLDNYFSALESVSRLSPKRILSAHDSFALDGKFGSKIAETVKNELHKADNEWFSPIDGKRFIRILISGENDESFFDFTIAENLVDKETV